MAERTPRDGVEVAVARCFERTLGVPVLDVDDDFFELGGTSMLAEVAANDLRGAVGVDIGVADLLVHPTVARVAELVRLGGGSCGLLIPIASGGEPPVFFVPASGDVFELWGLRHAGLSRAILGIRAAGLFPGETPSVGTRVVAANYVAAVRRHQPVGPYVLAGFCMGGLVALEMASQLEAAGQRVDRVVLVDAPPRRRPAGLTIEAIIEERLRDLRGRLAAVEVDPASDREDMASFLTAAKARRWVATDVDEQAFLRRQHVWATNLWNSSERTGALVAARRSGEVVFSGHVDLVASADFDHPHGLDLVDAVVGSTTRHDLPVDHLPLLRSVDFRDALATIVGQ